MRFKQTTLVLALCAVLLVAGCGTNMGFTVNGPGASYNPVAALLDSAGNPVSRLATGDSVSFFARNCRPFSQYDIRVYKANREDTLVSYLRLTANAQGVIPDTIMAYDLESGEYYYTIEEVGAAKSLNATKNLKLTRGANGFSVNTESSDVRLFACDAAGTAKTAFASGEEVYVTGMGFAPGTTVNLYVLRDQAKWEEGNPLSDVSEVSDTAGSPEEAIADGSGIIAPTMVWSSAQTSAGNAFDIVADVDRDGSFDAATDIIRDHSTVGFVVQESNRTVKGSFNAQLACDSNRTYKDSFQTTEDIYLFINPNTRMQLGGDRYVKKYVVAHKDVWGNGDALVDVSGPNNAWDADTVQFGCTNEGRVLVWPAPVTPGLYDVVIDVNRNGIYDEGIDIIDGIGTRNGSMSPGFKVLEPRPAKKWTFMVFINADNNLDSEGLSDIGEMISSGGSNEDVNIVAQIDRESGAPWETVRRYYVTAGMDIDTGYLSDLGELDCGDPETLINFVTWAKAEYPAEKYALVIWNHGSGVRKNLAGGLFKNISFDDTDNNDLNMEELRYALSRIKDVLGKKVDLLGMDACLMAMTEVAYQIRDFADYMVGSQNTEPGDGWPYDVILPRLLGTPSMAAATLAGHIVNDYVASYPSNGTVTQSALDLSKLQALRDAVDNFARKMMAKMSEFRTILQTQRNNTQYFSSSYPDYRDLYHFAELVEANAAGDEGADIRAAAAAVKTAMLDTVIAENHGAAGDQTGRGSMDNAHGLCIWLPDRADNSNYNSIYFNSSFAIDTQWNEFIGDLWGTLLRIELTWGAEPHDMDSYLWDTYGNFVAYYNMSMPGAYLDLDDTSSYGPENVTVTSYNIGGGQPYSYAVNLYSGSTPPTAPVVVKLFRGSNPAPAQTWSTSGFTGSLEWWHVFDFDPVTNEVTTVNTLSSGSPRGMAASKAPAKK